MYHIEYDYRLASAIHEQRIREAEEDRLAAAVRSARNAVRAAASRAGSMVRPRADARRAA